MCWQLKNKVFKIISICIILSLYIALYVFIHLTPERVIRADLFKQGYYKEAFKTEIYKSQIDTQYGERYSCKNPAIGPDFYYIDEGTFGLWYINLGDTGGG